MTPSQQAKAAGLKSLSQVRDMLGTSESGHPIVSLQTLINWHKNKPDLFDIILTGCHTKIAIGEFLKHIPSPEQIEQSFNEQNRELLEMQRKFNSLTQVKNKL